MIIIIMITITIILTDCQWQFATTHIINIIMIKVSEERRRSGTSSSSTEDSIVIRADPALDRLNNKHNECIIIFLFLMWMGPIVRHGLQ